MRKLDSLFDVASALEDIAVDLEKVKLLLENLTDTSWEYRKHNKLYDVFAESSYIENYGHISHDYVYKLMAEVRELSDYVYSVCWNNKKTDEKEPMVTSIPKETNAENTILN